MRMQVFHQKSGLIAEARRQKMFLNLFRKGEDGKFRIRDGVRISLDAQEAGELAFAILKAQGKAEFIHKTNDATKRITFEVRRNDEGKVTASLSVSAGDKREGISLSTGEIYILWRLINHVVDDYLKENAEEDARRRRARADDRAGTPEPESDEPLL